MKQFSTRIQIIWQIKASEETGDLYVYLTRALFVNVARGRLSRLDLWHSSGTAAMIDSPAHISGRLSPGAEPPSV